MYTGQVSAVKCGRIRRRTRWLLGIVTGRA
jgi:hypothetical protein